MKVCYSLMLLFCLACSQPTSDQIQQDTGESIIAKDENLSEVSGNSKELEVLQESGPMVYVTPEGDKYHTADCRYSKTSQAVKLSQAKTDGKTACNICKPNTKTGKKQIRCSAITAENKSCQRMTSDLSGKCFQHRDS